MKVLRNLFLAVTCLVVFGSACSSTTVITAADAASAEDAPPVELVETELGSESDVSAETASTTDPQVFCQSVLSLNAILLASGVQSLFDQDLQDYYMLSRVEELAAATDQVAAAAPIQYEADAKLMHEFFDRMIALAAERDLDSDRLAELAALVDSGTSVEALVSEFQVDLDDIDAMNRAAADGLEPDGDFSQLMVSNPAALGCDFTIALDACELIDTAQLEPFVGSDFTLESRPIEDISPSADPDRPLGSQCVVKGEQYSLVDITVGGTPFYQPIMWGEIEMVDGVGDEAFLTLRLDPPSLFVKEGELVVGVSVAGTDPVVTTEQLVAIAETILSAAEPG